MSTELAKIENYTAIDQAMGADIDGDPLRFKDGEFLRGFDKDVVKEGTELLVMPVSTSEGFIKWEGGRPVDSRFRELNDSGQLPIFRDTLGDTNEKDWPDGKDP
jgi:hypothetical protein